jgi:bacterioferritin-associated ferredoxin
MAVTKCVCFRRRFAELLPFARANGWTTAGQIADATGCGTGCGGCRPYLAAMLATGATAFRVRIDDQPPVPCEPDPWDRP